MIDLHNAETGVSIGQITEAQLQFLADRLEEESSQDQDYYIDYATLEMLQEAGADEALLTLLRAAVGDKEGIEVRWKR